MEVNKIASEAARPTKSSCHATTILQPPPLAPRMPEHVGQDDEPQLVESSRAETAGEEAQDEKAGGNPSKTTKRVQQPTSKQVTLPPKSELGDPRKLKEEWILWLLDDWRARAYVVYEKDQLDGTGLWNPTRKQDNPVEGLYISDGYDRTWFVPTDDKSPLPLSRQDIAESLKRRHDAMIAASSGDDSVALFNKLRLYTEQEAATMCQNEWDRNKNEPNLPQSSWTDVKSTLSTSVLLRMIAKTRLIDGRASLPGYYRVSVLELTTQGKLIQRRVSIPSDLDTAGVCLRLDTWFPVQGEQAQRVFKAAQKKINIGLKQGNDKGKELAQSCLKALGRPQYNLDGDGATWVFKLAARENYTLPVGKAPGRPCTWSGLIDEDALNALKEGVRSGKHPVMIRSWNLLLRRMWPHLEDMEDHLLPTTPGEPELTEAQFGILDKLLAEQTDAERGLGWRITRVLNWLNTSTNRFDFADFDDSVDS
ncbi:hypothetical protein B0J13DRAFT_616706 [Dactylonectria estremocensis]|uniref:Uncharacterized protein n=1 Tax=Dactylonectria estremocensis TaxID=1079267 RepID=A0A9P9JI82_9HYPO|nr:hypothetical protein B0J13DRAFT_616706 [Dactylonectria estremocensis]